MGTLHDQNAESGKTQKAVRTIQDLIEASERRKEEIKELAKENWRRMMKQLDEHDRKAGR